MLSSKVSKIFFLTTIPLIIFNDIAKSEYATSLAKENSVIQNLNKNNLGSENLGFEYLLGPGDVLSIKIFGLPELSDETEIMADGNIYLKQLNKIYANKLTITELKEILTNAYNEILIEPEITIALVKSRSVRVFIKGEVKKPGFYNLNEGGGNFTIGGVSTSTVIGGTDDNRGLLYPTLFDALKKSGGITPYSDLSDVVLIRENSRSNGGGKIKTNLNFLTLFEDGDQSQNIRMMDGDTVIVKKSDISLKEQLLEVNSSNMNPRTVSVLISGSVKSPGFVTLPKGSGLNQAIAATGGKNLLSGRIEFVRFSREGEVDRKVFAYNPKSSLDSRTNPILADGDIINVYDSLLGKSTAFLNKIVQPVAPTFYLLELLDLR